MEDILIDTTNIENLIDDIIIHQNANLDILILTMKIMLIALGLIIGLTVLYFFFKVAFKWLKY